jgi:ABC-type lipoprotein release transport system permease subunit
MKAGELRIIVPLAWRKVWRNKRRTILTLLTILVGCAMIILMNGLRQGGHDQMIEDAVSMTPANPDTREGILGLEDHRLRLQDERRSRAYASQQSARCRYSLRVMPTASLL